MRKTLAAIIASLALVFAGVPAFGATVPDDPTVFCNDAPDTGPAGCVPTECHQVVDRLNLALMNTRRLLTQERAEVAAQRATIARQHAKIVHQRHVIQRLRSRLARK